MKKKIIILCIISVLFIWVIGLSSEKISRWSVNHIEAGNFINTEQLKENEITMLHWFSKEVEVYSKDRRPLSFVVFDPYKGLIKYKNRNLMMQNETKKYPMYQGKNYMIFSICKEDYIDNRVNFYSETALDNINVGEYENNYFVGDFSNINDLIVVKNCIAILSIFLLAIGIVMLVILYKKEKNMVLLVVFAFLMVFNLKIGLILSTVVICFWSDSLMKKHTKKNLLIGIMFLSILLDQMGIWKVYSIDFYNLFFLSLLLLNIINLAREKSTFKFMTFIEVLILCSLLKVDYEFNFFRLFYSEILTITVALMLIVLALGKLISRYSKEEMVQVDLLRNISHDFRVPLTTIRLNTELLERDDFTSEINKGNIIGTIKSATEDLSNMTSSLTNYMTKDHYVDSKYHTSFGDCIERTASYFKKNDKFIDINLQISKEEIFLPIAETWLNRLIYNLIDNAYKYTDEYGEIIIYLKREKKQIVFSVEDSGIGMSEEQVAKILKPFYRVDQSRSITGLGLGLSIVKSIVDELDGVIDITSELGEGTKFNIRI